MYRLDRSQAVPVRGSPSFLGVSVGCFQSRPVLQAVDQQGWLPSQCGWGLSTRLRAGTEQKGRDRTGSFLPPDAQVSKSIFFCRSLHAVLRCSDLDGSYNTSPPEPPARRWQVRGLLSPCDDTGQLLT